MNRFFPLYFLAIFLGTAPPLHAEDKRPNILFIIVDDQSPLDLQTYRPESICHTPTIDQLAEEGMVLEDAYHMGSFIGGVCTPSRHMIMTGRTVWRLPNWANGRHCPDDIEENVLAEVFNRADYDTMRTCKRGNSYDAANKKFTTVSDSTKRQGNESGGSAWHAKQVLEFLEKRESNETSDPFLIYFGFSHPHDVRDGTPELLEKYGSVNHTDRDNPPALNDKQPPLPPNWLEEHPFDHGHLTVRDEIAVSGVWKRRDEASIRNELGREYACNENIDRQINKVFTKLETMGELDNTYIIYTADHGIAIGRHGLLGKQNLYQHTWRVPFIVKGPGIKPGRASGNSYLLDVLPTLCDMAGIEIPSSVEGKSLLPVLTGESDSVRETVYGVYAGGSRPGIRSVKKGDWKLIKYDVDEGRTRETQLFNLNDNPDELLEHNLAEDPSHSEKLAELEALLLSEMQRLDDPFPLWNQPTEKKRP